MDKSSDFMPNLTLGYGVFLVVWGIAVGLLSTSDSLTRFIPCAPGAGLVVSGVPVSYTHLTLPTIHRV